MSTNLEGDNKEGSPFSIDLSNRDRKRKPTKWGSNSTRRMRKCKKPKKGKSMIKKGSLGAQKKSSTSGGYYGRFY